MPEFKIEFWSNEIEDFIDFETTFQFYKTRIKSLMCFPLQEQEKKRDGYCAGLITNILDTPQCEEYLKDKQVCILHLEKICSRMLKDSPAFSDLHKEAHENFVDAGLAGEYLQGIWQFKKSSREDQVGVAKARFIHRGLPAGQELSDRKGESCWQKYNCIAHLHAARRFHSNIRSKRQLDLGFLRPDNLLDFLARAKELEEFATGHVPKHGQQVPLISQDEIWSIETNFSLPSVDMNAPKPHGEAKKLMRQYQFRNEL